MKPLSWNTLDWAALDRLRDAFLAGKPSGDSYWSSLTDLANYDFTYAQRIGWKWDTVLRELRLREWSPPPGPLLDWGCGSGIASRRVLEAFGGEAITGLHVFDRSSIAMQFAVERAKELFPRVSVEMASNIPHDSHPVGTLIISHVLNELDEADGRTLRQVIERANAVLWVEPGTFADSRALIAMREALREQFIVVAPCTHQAACGLLSPDNERHWCHHFAAPPTSIMADSNWVRFAQRAGIDLRRLPYSFLVLERRGLRDLAPGLWPASWSRVLGEPRVYKGFARVLSCRAEGVRELELQKRDAPEVFKAMKSGETLALLRGSDDGRRFNSLNEFKKLTD
jgi:hypothetical protein